ncbi:zf-TFIIB domain-containing protein [Haloglomus halophilum]|jgi:tRNA(Ile2) C34 agmatinyltransferase TiaS|uniref:zf-TFIIB domain-containing protein n=1 Tax=Haloglomus halophilum TaxID=2962672 RepID=UPI003313272E
MDGNCPVCGGEMRAIDLGASDAYECQTCGVERPGEELSYEGEWFPLHDDMLDADPRR